MTARARITTISAAVLLGSLAASIGVLHWIERVRSDAIIQETLYIPSPKVLKKLSFGYDGLAADIYWTRVVQYFGGLHHQQAGHYELLYPLLDIATTFDPHLLPAYQFGSIFLSQQPPEGAGQPEKAIEIMNRGIAANPTEWKLYFNLGFIYYDMKDYAGASRVFAAGSKVPYANPALAVMAGTTAEKGGSPETARLIWTEIYDTTRDKTIRSNALTHLSALRINAEVPRLAKLVRDYSQSTGHLPSSFEEMVAAGWLRSVPLDPTGDEYKLLPGGRVEIRSPKLKPFVEYGLPGGPQGPDESQPAAK
jgi:tetratricopeptide (TPR) repeat protein